MNKLVHNNLNQKGLLGLHGIDYHQPLCSRYRSQRACDTVPAIKRTVGTTVLMMFSIPVT